MGKVKISKFWSPNPKEKLAQKNGRSLVLQNEEKIDSGLPKTNTLFAVRDFPGGFNGENLRNH